MPRSARSTLSGVLVAAVLGGAVAAGPTSAALAAPALESGAAGLPSAGPAAASAPAVRPHVISTPAALNASVGRALRSSTATTRAVDVAIAGFGTVVAANAAKQMRPASNEKLFVALPTLLAGTASRRFVTTVRAVGTVSPDGVLTGSLVLDAAGDPSLRTADLAAIATAIRAAGIHAVTGDLWVDNTHFDTRLRAAGWRPNFVPDELGPLTAFVVDRNGWRTDAAYLNAPTAANLQRFRLVLAAAHLQVKGANMVGAAPVGGVQVAAHSSAPVAALLAHTLKVSDNFYAEMLLKELGAQAGNGSTAGGVAAIRATAARLRVTLGTLADGSGLSAYDRESPAAEVSWLRAAAVSPVGTSLRLSLPIGCYDGTLKHRFCGTIISHRVWAKTGTLDHVNTLAGYTFTRRGRLATFSIMLSGVRNGTAAMAAIDHAVVAIAAFTG